MVKFNSRKINILVQAAKIRNQFPESKVTVKRNILVWKHSLKPTPLSDSYDIKLEYKFGFHPSVNVINKKLELFPGEKKLPHVYDTEKQWLCLYYKKANEWNSQMLIAMTIVPWISEWLYHYEFWLATGKWFGKGIHGRVISSFFKI